MSFRDVPEQHRVKRFLRRLILSGRMPHALLFSGMRGTGKAALAFEFAKLLNCLKQSDPAITRDQELDCCDHCKSCRKLNNGNHPDVVTIGRQGAYIKIEQIRPLKERLRFRPFEGRWRVVIIEDAQDLKMEAGNALLKLLEEPPQQNLFILCVPESQMLLPTIVSRCCHVRFQPLSEEWISSHIMESYNIDEAQARWIAAASGGSLEQAQRWVDEDRMTHQSEVLAKISRLNKMSMLDFFAFIEKWSKENTNLEQDLECIKFWLRNQLFQRFDLVSGDYSWQDDVMPALVKEVPAEQLLNLLGIVEQSIQNLRSFANKQLTLERVCLYMRDVLDGKGCRNSV